MKYALFTLLITSSTLAQPAVRLLRTPDSGLQPQLAIGPHGTLHLLYYKGDPRSGDLFYSFCSKDAAEFAPGVRVNSIDGAACAFGNMRGGQIALAPDGRVHIAWNGSEAAADHLKDSTPGAKRHGGEPMLYTRSNADRNAFEPERDLMSRTCALDGGGSITIANDGCISVVWHASTPETESQGEVGRRIFIASSTDRGVTFSTESPIPWPDESPGMCGCCALKAFADKDNFYVIFRAAGEKVHRDSHLLTSTDRGQNFTDKVLTKWQLAACPMTTSSIISSPNGPILAWESEGNVYWSRLTGEPVAAPGRAADRKFPSVTVNPKGEVLLAWCEGMTFGKSGSLHWLVFDRDGKAINGAAGSQEGVPAWSLITAFTEPDGSFAIIY